MQMRRLDRWPRAGCAFILGAVTGLSACGAPRYTYSADYTDNTYFKVPYGWHQLTPAQIATGLHGAPPAGVWTAAFDAGKTASSEDLESFLATSPVVLAEVFKVKASVTAGLSYNGLEDSFLPVTPAARQAISGSSLSNFKLLNRQMLTPGQGVHGVQVMFQYTDEIVPGLNVADTFGLVALTNDIDTQVYLLFVHCTSSCYSQDQKAIDDVMTSFTVRSP